MTASDQEWQDKISKVMRRVAKDLIANDETEISEVVRRRLFQDLGSDKVRKNVCKAFGDWCFERRAQLPPEWTAVDSAATETKSREFLLRRFEACYPFHPATLSVFQRKWQALPQYQQTRGTLAMLAQWISIAAQESFRKARTEPLITLGSAPLEELGFRSVVTAPACRACGPRAASCSARVARVGGHRRIDQVTNGGGVQDVGPVLEVDQVRQGHRRVRDDQRHVPGVRRPSIWCRVSPAASPRGRVPDASARCRLRRRPSCSTTNRASASASHFHWSTWALVSATRLMSLRLSQTMNRAASRGPAGIVCTGMT